MRRELAKIGANERVIDLVENSGVEPALGDEVRDGAERRGAAFEPAGEAHPPLALGLGSCGGFRDAVVWTVLHAAPVIAVSA